MTVAAPLGEDDSRLRAIPAGVATVAVPGASARADRSRHRVMRYLLGR